MSMNTSTRICLARHGETDWNNDGILQGWIDVPVNRRGRDQAREMAQRLRDESLDLIWSSPLARANETAEIIANELDLPPPNTHPGLMERNFGMIQGVPKAELMELNPVLYQQIAARNAGAHFEDGETMDEFADRVENALRDIAAVHPGRRVLVITHGWVLDVLIRRIRGLPRGAPLHIKPKNGECLWLEVQGERIAPVPA